MPLDPLALWHRVTALGISLTDALASFTPDEDPTAWGFLYEMEARASDLRDYLEGRLGHHPPSRFGEVIAAIELEEGPSIPDDERNCIDPS